MDVLIPKAAHWKRVPRQAKARLFDRWRDKWALTEDWWVKIDGEWWCVPKGYVFDGATIPRIFWWIWPPTYGPAIHASIFHDRCYTHWWKIVDKAWADEALRVIMIAEGARRSTARTFWLGVRANVTGGGWS